MTDRLDLVAGLRWVDEDKDGTFEQFEANNAACLNALANAGAIGAQAPAGLEAFAAGAGATVAGFTCFPFAVPADLGVAGLPTSFDLNFSDEELIWTVKGAYELGLKTDLLDSRLRLNTALFYQDIEDFPVLEFTGVQFQTFNVPKARSKGVEVELQATPMNQLDLSLAVTYQDASYPGDCDGNAADALPQVSALCGSRLTNAPDWAGVLGLTWEDSVPGTSLSWFAQSNVRWESKRRTSTLPVREPTAEMLQPALDDFQDANAKVNLRLGIGAVDDSWALELWGNNILDEQTKNVTFNVPLRGATALGTEGRGVYIEAPRTFGATFRLRR